MMESDSPPSLEVRGLSKNFARRSSEAAAVEDMSFIVAAGQVYAFLGPNGAGKSTVIRMILGLIRPSSGRVFLFGRDSRDRLALHRVGSLVDGGTFYPFLSGRRNLEVLARTQGHRGDMIEPLLERVGLSSFADQKVRTYSTGMRQLLGVAAALLNDPELVILDEPTNGLDVQGISRMRRIISRMIDERKTVFLSSHLLHEVELVCKRAASAGKERVAIVGKGRMIREDSINELLDVEGVTIIDAYPVDAALAALAGQWEAEATSAGVRVKAGRDAVPEIVRSLLDCGVDIYRVSSEARSLEDIFEVITRGATLAERRYENA